MGERHLEPSATSILRVREARPEDLAPVLDLLEAVDLPRDGVAESFDGFVVAEAEGRLVGAAGLERLGPYALLRSVVVDPTARGAGVAKRLVERLLEQSEREEIREVYLLTTTAERYFPRFGFRPVPRDSVPAEVQRSAEFASLCPSSATAMARRAGSSSAGQAGSSSAGRAVS